MFSITAINESDSRSRLEPLAPTREAQESHLTKLYQDALLNLQNGDYVKAQSLFLAIIQDPLSIKSQRDTTTKNNTMLHLRFLAFKNLAEAMVKQGPKFYNDALHYFTQAVKIDGKEVVLWNRLGTVACSLGRLNIARRAFEQGLYCSSRHWSCMEKLVEVLIAIGDEKGCLSVVKRLLKISPQHARARHIKQVIEEHLSSDISNRTDTHLMGLDTLEPQHNNLTFLKKRRLDAPVVPAKRRRQHCTQLVLSEPSWLAAAKGVIEAFKNRELGHLQEAEKLKDKGSYLANSRVSLVFQSPEQVEKADELVTTQDASLLMEKAKLSEAEERHAQERRSTRLGLRSRKVDKCEAVADCPKSLRQSLEDFIVDKPFLHAEEEETGMVQSVTRGDCRRINSCLIYTSSDSSCTNVSFCESEANSSSLQAKEVLEFVKNFASNSGVYHIGQEILEKVVHSTPRHHSELQVLHDLESYTRIWSKARSPECSLFLAELYADAASTSKEAAKVPRYLKDCNYNVCKVVESVALDVPVESVSVQGSLTSSDMHIDQQQQHGVPQKLGWTFWVRFHWLNGRYCMMSGNRKKGFNEFKSCLSILQEQQGRYTVILPHCKADNTVSLKMVEQKLYESEISDLLKNSARKMSELGQHAELIQVLASPLFSVRGKKRNVFASSKCSEVTQSPEFNALNMLVSSCEHVKPANLTMELRCHMRKLEILYDWAALQLYKAEEDCLLSGSSSDSDDDKTKEVKVLNKHMAEGVKLISKCAAAVLEKMDDSSLRSISMEIGRTQDVLLSIMVHFGSTLASKKLSNLSLHDQLESNYFLDAAVAFCRLQHIHPAAALEKQVALLVTVHELLAERGICSVGEGSFLKMAIKHMLGLEAVLKQSILLRSGNINQDSQQTEAVPDSKATSRSSSCNDLFDLESKSKEREELRKKKAEFGLDTALDQCFFCLYGLNFRADLETGKPDSLAVHKTTNCGEFQTKEQCAAVLQYVLPYAKACSKAGLLNIRKVLQAVRNQFPHPPAYILQNDIIEAFLEDVAFDEATLSDMLFSKASMDEIMEFAFPKRGQDPERAIAEDGSVEEDESYSEVYKQLYYLLTQVEDAPTVDKFPGFVLTKEGEDQIEENAKLYKYDLLYNLTRLESWQKLASIYDEEVDLLLNDGSKNVNVLEWRKNSRYTTRVESSRRRSRRCLMMTLALSNSRDQQFMAHELLALVYYDTIQNAVPSYDQRQLVQMRDTLWVSRCLNAFRHFESAFSLRPEWTHLFYMGKLCEKLGKPYEEAFSFYRRAIDVNPSVVDPLYRLHRSRWKLLCKGRYHDLQIIQVVAKFCHLPTTEENVNKLLSSSHRSVDINLHPEENEDDTARLTNLASAWRLLVKDCYSAMQACVEGELKHFHKARFCIAQGLYNRAEEDDLERAKEELAFCFRSGRSLFTVNMWELDGVMKKNKRKTTGGTSARKALELGIPESSRKFITCVRKYLLLYIKLCEKAGDVVTLERAYTTIRQDKRFNICLEDIAAVALSAYIRSLAAAIGNAEKTGSHALQGFLERMFNLFMDHGVAWPEISEGASDGSDVADKSVYCYIHRYLLYLENDIRVDSLELVNERIRKRFKNPKLAHPSFSQVCRHATLAWCRALCCALSSITPLEKQQQQQQQYSPLIVDLQYDVLFSSPSDIEALSKISVASDDGNAVPASAAYIMAIKAIPVVQVTQENAEKAHALLRAAFVFYREVTSGPFPNGINLFIASSSAAPSEQQPSAFPGYELLDLSTPRKLLLWAFALVHGRAASMADVVKYCEDQAKTRLKKWPQPQPQLQQQQQQPQPQQQQLPQQQQAICSINLPDEIET